MTRDCFFTSIALNYLPKALALAESVFRIYPASRMVIAILDLGILSEEQRQVLRELVEHFESTGRKLEFFDPLTLYVRPDLFRYKFSVVEACTSVKPAVAIHLLGGASTVTYLDPDTLIYAPLPLGEHGPAEDWDFQVTPHVVSPATRGALISERLFMLRGTFNLGYFAVRARPQSLAFLEWWKHFCVNFGADAPEAGLFVDQKPVDLLPSFVDKVSVLRHPGCNVAWWNIFSDGRRVEPGLKVTHAGNATDLVFFHFSNLHQASDPAERLVANPLIQFRDTPGARLRMAEHPVLEKLYADYESQVLSWQDLARKLSEQAPLAMKITDAPAFVRQLLAEAMRHGMDYPNDPFRDAPRTVGWRCAKYVARHASKSDWRTAIASGINMLRLLMAPRLLRQAHQN